MKKLMLVALILAAVTVVFLRSRSSRSDASWSDMADSAKDAASKMSGSVKDAVTTAAGTVAGAVDAAKDKAKDAIS